MHSDHGGYDAALCGWDHCVCEPCPDCLSRLREAGPLERRAAAMARRARQEQR